MDSTIARRPVGAAEGARASGQASDGRRGRRPATRRLAAAAGAILVVLVAAAGPAAAHAGDDRGPSNHRIAIDDGRPVDGVRARLVLAETAVELTWSGPGELLVLGYDDEPYLRFDAGGVWVNRSSPATYLNASYDGEAPPPEADAAAEPRWELVADGRTHRWHDHRFHPPASPPADAGRRQLVGLWALPLVVDGHDAAVTGRIEWVPPPPAWPWWLAAAALAAGGLVAARRLGAAAVAAALGLAVAADVARVAGILGEVGGGWATLVDLAAISGAGWALAIAGTALAARRRRSDALVAAALAGGVVALAGGFLEAGDLRTSQLPSTLPLTAARAAIAVALGAGLGAAAGATVTLLRRGTR